MGRILAGPRPNFKAALEQAPLRASARLLLAGRGPRRFGAADHDAEPIVAGEFDLQRLAGLAARRSADGLSIGAAHHGKAAIEHTLIGIGLEELPRRIEPPRQVREMPLFAGTGAKLDVIDVDADPLLRERYDERVPVLVCNGIELCHYHLDEPRVREAYLGG